MEYTLDIFSLQPQPPVRAFVLSELQGEGFLAFMNGAAGDATTPPFLLPIYALIEVGICFVPVLEFFIRQNFWPHEDMVYMPSLSQNPHFTRVKD